MKRKLHNFEKLQAWQTAARIDKSIYTLTKTFPNKEQYFLSSHIQRASICSNIAEGSKRNSKLINPPQVYTSKCKPTKCKLAQP